ncbi:hypothetical protein FEK34_17840 [Nocardia cyriacigeorgica]|uniref:Uncharacterized protein n=1 Tax=Nocardia cyriacigeorgica TaxID=135487 RepID=A0A5R8NM39_9NOCA|nr:hypothetical protein FEK34_17840 [Nocardia cyriacigeorgica]
MTKGINPDSELTQCEYDGYIGAEHQPPVDENDPDGGWLLITPDEPLVLRTGPNPCKTEETGGGTGGGGEGGSGGSGEGGTGGSGEGGSGGGESGGSGEGGSGGGESGGSGGGESGGSGEGGAGGAGEGESGGSGAGGTGGSGAGVTETPESGDGAAAP